MPEVRVEVCANSLQSAIAAQEGGAHRIELCSDLQVGGLTPSAATIKLAIQKLKIPVFVLIRPRAGDFFYDKIEFQIMKEDILYAKNCGAAGVVFGILNPMGQIDVQRCTQLVALARPMEVTFHRAFDCIENYKAAIEDVVKTGAGRILTAGLCKMATEGKDIIKTLVTLAGKRILIMAGGGINPLNVSEIIKSGVSEIHASCSVDMPDNSSYSPHQKSLYYYKKSVTSAEIVSNLIHNIKSIK